MSMKINPEYNHLTTVLLNAISIFVIIRNVGYQAHICNARILGERGVQTLETDHVRAALGFTHSHLIQFRLDRNLQISESACLLLGRYGCSGNVLGGGDHS